ncbi:dCTP deaminase [Candidatus Gottesmanbacteria bacterium RIFCSPHIGHO2_02_FULL_39_14]|uniref:dCTP deaminase n=2 Tax=Candidatus Gottesmaniibacteriota TaxID=1752720 RepID=A0A1F6A0R5_9BACT|nr:MAG: dCTP deaminase [Candidatus Gottesmanbacteria bacterium RIFCSPHIGHO2_02_FULL_39_14]OGG32065.1 MAG: dCTP deaminase [Candidatus Gottesmanbacteria bacterium RIFCSPLOWO2_02_FULL_38_8]
MVLSDRDIRKCLASGKIKIDPQPDLRTQLGSCSIDLRLGRTFRIFEHSKVAYVDPFDAKNTDKVTKLIEVKDKEPFILHPSDFVLATTIESFTLPDDLLARLEGRSSLGRLGIVVHSTASIFEPGWRGKVVMELGNLGRMPIALYPGMRICALTFERLTTPVEVPYYRKKGAKYLDQDTPGASKINQEG